MSKPKKNHVLQITSWQRRAQGGSKGGSQLGGPSKNSGKLKIIYLVDLMSKLKKNHVLQIVSWQRRVQGVAKGGSQLGGPS